MNNAFEASVFVFFIQFILIFILMPIIINGFEGFAIVLPNSISVLGARFVCSILMHLQCESDLRQGISMMKYVVNHSDSFSNPGYAYLIALM